MADQPRTSDGAGASERELQVSSAAFLVEVERLGDLERQKQVMSPGDEARESTAREIEDTVLELVSRSRYQTRLVELQREPVDGSDVEPRRPGVILEEWRTAERELNKARTAMERASDDAERLREEHRRSVRRPAPEAHT